MKKSIFRFFLEAYTPFMIVVVLYIAFDPFLLIKDYDTFYESGKPAYVDRNNDYVSTSTYDRQNSIYRYNSFIFGNSRSRYYKVQDWLEYLDTKAVCYHFDASNESLYGILKKVEYVDKFSDIKNVLLILDSEILSVTTPQTYSYLFYLSPQLVDNTNIFDFHLSGFKTFVNPKFFFSYIDLMIFGEIRNYMRHFKVFNEEIRNYNQQWNETSWPQKEKQINNGEYYTTTRLKQFYNRDTIQKYANPCIFEEQIIQLSLIEDIFRKNKTNYKIIISPKYDQKKLSQADIHNLVTIFGLEKVFDFSGINEYTQSYSNFYNINHYKSDVAKDIMKKVYSN